MNHKEKLLLQKEVLYQYNKMMPQLYVEYRNYSTEQVRLEVLRILTNHVISKCSEKINKRRRRKLNNKIRTNIPSTPKVVDFDVEELIGG